MIFKNKQYQLCTSDIFIQVIKKNDLLRVPKEKAIIFLRNSINFLHMI